MRTCAYAERASAPRRHARGAHSSWPFCLVAPRHARTHRTWLPRRKRCAIPAELGEPIRALLQPDATVVMRGDNRLEFWWVKGLPLDTRTRRASGVVKRRRRSPRRSGKVDQAHDRRPWPADEARRLHAAVCAAATGRRPHGCVTASRVPAGCTGGRGSDSRTRGSKGAVALAKKTLGKSHPATLSLNPTTGRSRRRHPHHGRRSQGRGVQRPCDASGQAGRCSVVRRDARRALRTLMQLHDRVVLITGGKRIGADIALALAARGADVALCYRESRTEAEATAHAVREARTARAAHPGGPACAGRLSPRRGRDRHLARAARRSRQHGVRLRQKAVSRTHRRGLGTLARRGSTSCPSVCAGGRAAHAYGRAGTHRQFHRLGRGEPAPPLRRVSARTTSRKWA